jgi:hypothetical protein
MGSVIAGIISAILGSEANTGDKGSGKIDFSPIQKLASGEFKKTASAAGVKDAATNKPDDGKEEKKSNGWGDLAGMMAGLANQSM